MIIVGEEDRSVKVCATLTGDIERDTVVILSTSNGRAAKLTTGLIGILLKIKLMWIIILLPQFKPLNLDLKVVTQNVWTSVQ